MPAGRIFQDCSITLGDSVSLTEPASHYLLRVLRAKVGESIIVFNGQGGEYQAVITSVSKRSVFVEFKNFHDVNLESPVQIELGQALLRGDKMDWVIQKSVELGVNAITPLLTERITIKLQADRLAKRLLHWRSIAISACEQSGRCVVPIINAPVNITDWILASKIPTFIAFPRAKDALPKSLTSQQARIVIGPEGGLSSNDLEQCHTDFCYPFSMGPRILRTETAAIAALTMMQVQWGGLS